MIACPENERQTLEEAVQFLSGKAQEVQTRGKSIGSDRLLALTALNLANELMQLGRVQGKQDRQLYNQLAILQNKIDAALIKEKQMEL